jgi:hypothetical protein
MLKVDQENGKTYGVVEGLQPAIDVGLPARGDRDS